MTPEEINNIGKALLNRLNVISRGRMDKRNDCHGIRIYVGQAVAFAYSTWSDDDLEFTFFDGWIMADDLPIVRVDAITHMEHW